VEEALTFSAAMSLPKSVPLDEIPAAVDTVIRQLALEKVSHPHDIPMILTSSLILTSFSPHPHPHLILT